MRPTQGGQGRDRQSALVQTFMAEHRRVHMHYTPTYSSWLNQVENWFCPIFPMIWPLWMVSAANKQAVPWRL